MLEYAPKGLIGLLTPQANTTVEPEFSILMAPGYAFLNARLVSDKATIEDRLGDYFAGMADTAAEFANAPLGAYAFACTGASYLQGRAREDDAVRAIEDARGRPFVTAGRAVAEVLQLIGARRIGLVSPYPSGLTEASIGYWRAHGFDVASVTSAFNSDSDFHPIYSLGAAAASSALDRTADEALDAIVMLGTGMPTLGPILAHAAVSELPVLSCMSALAWRTLAVFDPGLRNAAEARRYLSGHGWRQRYDNFLAPNGP
jgi:maleate cis-trans isomerase